MPRTDSLEAQPGNSSGWSRYSWVNRNKNWSGLIQGNLRYCIIEGLKVLISLVMKVQLHLHNSLQLELELKIYLQLLQERLTKCLLNLRGVFFRFWILINFCITSCFGAKDHHSSVKWYTYCMTSWHNDNFKTSSDSPSDVEAVAGRAVLTVFARLMTAAFEGSKGLVLTIAGRGSLAISCSFLNILRLSKASTVSQSFQVETWCVFARGMILWIPGCTWWYINVKNCFFNST